MFKKAVGSAIILLILALSYLAYYCFYILPKDITRYEKYLQDVTPSTKKKTSKEQYRQGIQKDIWHLHNGQRLHYQIRAQSSSLLLTPIHHTFSLQENLKNIDCLLQEKIYLSNNQLMQQVREFHANAGVYDFSTHQFTTDKIYLSMYTLAGNDLPEGINSLPFLKGYAKKVLLTLSSTQGPAFHADKFIAAMDLD